MNPITIEQILEDWKVDCVINESRLNEEITRTPNLHSKYLSYFMFFKRKLTLAEAKLNKLCYVKKKYYRGEMTREELQEREWSQYQGLKPSASELTQLLDFDHDVIDLKTVVSEYKMSVSCIEYILGQIKGREFSTRSLVDYQKFLSGG